MNTPLTAQTQRNQSMIAEVKDIRKSSLSQGVKRQPIKSCDKLDNTKPQQFQFWYR